MIVFEEIYPYMNNFHFPVKRDIESVIPVLPPKKTSTPLRARVKTRPDLGQGELLVHMQTLSPVSMKWPAKGMPLLFPR